MHKVLIVLAGLLSAIVVFFWVGNMQREGHQSRFFLVFLWIVNICLLMGFMIQLMGFVMTNLMMINGRISHWSVVSYMQLQYIFQYCSWL